MAASKFVANNQGRDKAFYGGEGNRQRTSGRLVFGTYRLKNAVLEVALDQALHELAASGDAEPLVDTAVMYGNSETVAQVLERHPNARVGTKLHRVKTLEADLNHQVALFGKRLHRVLLHRHMPLSAWRILEQAKAKGLFQEIGVSNYSSLQLTELLENSSCKPDVVQNELHPFLRTSVPDLCAEHGIRFEAHSALTGIDHYPNDLVRQTGASPAQIAIAYALQKGGSGSSVAFSTADYTHLRQDLDVVTIPREQLARLALLENERPFHRYPGADRPLSVIGEPWHYGPTGRAPWTRGEDNDTLLQVVLPALLKDLQKQSRVAVASDAGIAALSAVSVCIPNPSRGSKAADVLNTLGALVFPSPDGACKPLQNGNLSQKGAWLHALVKTLRKRFDATAKALKEASRPTTCKLRAVEAPEALPVKIPPPEEFVPFIEMLQSCRQKQQPLLSALRFQRGVMFPDGRMDMCKQVSQPAFEDLCQAVRCSSMVRHFLLGNNLAFDGDAEGSRERSLVSLIQADPEIETWYLAGNAIGPTQLKSIAAAFEQTSHAKYLWFKMNPIKLGASHLGNLVARNPRIELLDLFNTGLCDDGVGALLAGLGVLGRNGSQLRHLYLDINAITPAAPLPELLRRLPALESLYLSVNRLGDEGVAGVLSALQDHSPSNLVRLGLGSNRLSDECLDVLAEFIGQMPSLCVLELGSYKSTRFFREAENAFTDARKLCILARCLHANAADSPRPGKTFFGFQNAYAGDVDAGALVDRIVQDNPGQFVNGIQRGKSGRANFTAAQLGSHGKYGFIAPAPVEFIQSVYRMAM